MGSIPILHTIQILTPKGFLFFFFGGGVLTLWIAIDKPRGGRWDSAKRWMAPEGSMRTGMEESRKL